MDALKIYEDALDELASDLITEDEFTKIIKCLRDVQEVKHGHWVEFGKREEDGNYVFQCPYCDETWAIPCKNAKEFRLNYCANCGAKMDEEADNDKNTE